MVPISSILHILSVAVVLDNCLINGELFTAISEVEPLLETHKKIIDDLDHYIMKEEERLSILKDHLVAYRREHEMAMDDIPNYLGNPINAFTLIKRLTADLDHIEQSIRVGTEYIKNVTINHPEVKYPAIEDLSGAAQALIRLQETYKLDTKDLSEGKLNGVIYSTPMTAGDCFELGRTLYNDRNYKNSLPWLMEALERFRDEKKTYTFGESDILEYISFGYYLSGDFRNALKWTQELLKLDPEHPRAAGNVPHYQKMIAEDDSQLQKKRRGDTGDEDYQEQIPYSQERKNYEALCRGEMDIPAEITSRLKCWYITENHPFLKLAPIKVEQMYIKPDVFVFHQVMSDDEIEFIKETAKPRFQRAVVHDPRTGELVAAHYRISKSSWIKDEESKIIAAISQRVSDMTRLSMESAEELQVVNYGIGGHYEPHFDFARKWEIKQENAFGDMKGNRIATVLFYMSDVSQGGATVFTELGLSVFPIKGAALFWLNLHPSGEGDLATRHAACPVLHGSKWVSNKWIHQGGQELLMPCNLEYQDEGMARKIPRPIPKTSR